MPSYCTSFSISRRRFLQGLLALGGLALYPELIADALAHKPLPIYWLSLEGKIIHTESFPIPYGMPGSIMKLVAATALLEDRLISPNQVFECRGSLECNGDVYHCQQAHGRLNLVEALGVSCNLFFVQAAKGLSAARFLDYAKSFQLHEPFGGNYPFQFPKAAPKLPYSQPYVLGLSPEIQPNALQLLHISQIIATRGIPNIQPATWALLHQGMQVCALRGTAQKLDPQRKLHIAAKTGTTPHGNNYQSWLIGYFPYAKPKYIFCVRSMNGTAKDSAVPLASLFLSEKTWP